MSVVFDQNAFKGMVIKNGYTNETFANALGMTRETLYRRVSDNGSFSRKEIAKMIELCGEKDVIDALFSSK